MANIIDYIKWRGDLSFEASPVNEVDQLIFAYIAYVSMDDFFKDGITVKDAAQKFFETHTEEEVEKDKSFIHLAPMVLKEAGVSVRFGDLQMFNYRNDINVSREEQFAAVCLYLPHDDSLQVAYRGTDDTLIGWKEDFNMSFIMPVPSQKAALKYLQGIGEKSDARKLRVCGHSKGGNLAVYSAAKCKPDVRDRIVSVYNLDGPGFDKKMLADKGYKAVQDKVTTIVPQSSIIGMLLEHEEEYTVIESSQTGMLQHDGMSWQVLGKSFVHVDEMDTGAKLFDASLKEWLSALDNEQRKKFVDILFDVLLAGHFDTVSELSKNSLSALAASIQAMTNLPEADRNMFLKTIGMLMSKVGGKFSDNMRKMIGQHWPQAAEKTPEEAAADDEKKAAAAAEKAEAAAEKAAAKETAAAEKAVAKDKAAAEKAEAKEKAEAEKAAAKEKADADGVKKPSAAESMQAAFAKAQESAKETAAAAQKKLSELLDNTKKQ